MQSAEIRRRFLDYFARKGHTPVPSASLLLDDPTLLFVNAGMVPFKPFFVGDETPPYSTATSVQKCVRTLDIEEVGKTARHASFFQMCGNFSFGDYFKSGAIPMAWELLTTSQSDGGFGLAEDKLWVTVYLDDDEAADIWHKDVGIPRARIQRLGKADNFWSMGVPGPCGPCSEIYYDRGPAYGVDGGPEANDTRYMEIWNLVFMQFERGPGTGKEEYPILGELPAKNIDTGMGLERLAALLQGVENIYEIDTTRHILDAAKELSGKHYGQNEHDDVALRVVADHSRTAAFLIGDGVTPGNEGRGYVLRRIMRRVIRNMRLLGAPDHTMVELVRSAITAMGEQYPELVADTERITRIADGEERAFLSTLRTGTQIFENAVTQLAASGATALPGAQAFALHDTYGFPIDLTLEMASEKGLSVDEDGFRALMAEQRARAKADTAARKAGIADHAAFRAILDQSGTTEWLAYEGLDCDARIIGLLTEADSVPVLAQGQVGTVVLDRTTFYAESGGQHADAGLLIGDGFRAEVLDVQRPVKGLVAHQVRVLEGELVLDAPVRAQVDPLWRLGARQAHSGTHVVHAALREVLGPTALQAGSFNRPGYLRLDFNWSQGLSRTSRSDIEAISNRAVRDDLPVTVEHMTLERAREVGALALFGETYGELVRVVEIGGPWSRELCGGTHVTGSAQIGPLVVTAETSVGSGVRRLEAVVGLPAYEYLARERDLVSQLAEIVKAPRDELPTRVEGALARLKDAERELEKIRKDQLRSNVGSLLGAPRQVGDAQVYAVRAPDGMTAGELREVGANAADHTRSGQPAVILLAAAADGKAALLCTVNEAGRGRGLSAQALLKEVMPLVGGRGGGKDDVAQGGGTDPGGVDGALAAVSDAVARALAG